MPMPSGSSVAPKTEPILTAKEVARALGITRRTLWRWLAQGILPEPRRITSRTIRWKKSDIDSLIASRHA